MARMRFIQDEMDLKLLVLYYGPHCGAITFFN